MVSDLPKELQKKIERYLLNDNFSAAKAIHDNWLETLKGHNRETFAQVLVIAEPATS
jgi:hypothetical protein